MSLLGSMMHALQRVGSYRRSSNSPQNSSALTGANGANMLAPPSPSKALTTGASTDIPTTATSRSFKAPSTLQVPTFDQTSKELTFPNSVDQQKKNTRDSMQVKDPDITEPSSEISEEIPLKQSHGTRKELEKPSNVAYERPCGFHPPANQRVGFPNLPVYVFVLATYCTRVRFQC
ncbi:unnamed protein product [Hydatigera taeniaeformis]|uniref:Uncharacterized protein n=1 Tax=Hydatigena taeniaeformis TaxID=6205 RepID=A0A0R3WYH0_HYDTA|nr:unnamed protein product [Hydatigera taeniaeformis]